MIEKSVIDNIAIIHLVNTTKVNAINSDTILQVLEQNIQVHDGLVFNLESVGYFDSTGFNMLLRIYDKARKLGKRVVLTGISNELMGLFQITKLNTVFEIYSDNTQAINQLKNQKNQ
ncbi:MAG TPA: STAS domain-containing protein [Salinivirgaceae bacterium]|nr:STAS domain-containing protein [Salinivirgaceae bacterium]